MDTADIAGKIELSAPEKLIGAALSAWERDGASDISARNLAANAGLRASSIHYHFGGLGRLLDSAQQEAVAAAARWCDARWAAICPDATSPKMLAPLLAGMIDDWCETQRRLAFACREGHLMALRDPSAAPLAARWEALWHGHFTRLCGQLGLGDLATLTAWFFDGASGLHMLRWRRPLDRAALDELCGAWGNWTAGRLASDGPCYALCHADAERLAPPGAPDTVADPLAAAAAATLAEGGVTTLTHRAVAERAGMTLGMVSYRYRTSSDLLQAAFQATYQNMVSGGGSVSERGLTETETATETDLPALNAVLGMEELAVAAARREDLRPFGARFRYLRGQSAIRNLRAILPDRPLSLLDQAVFSALLAGRTRSYLATGRPSDVDRRVRDLAPIFARFGID